MELALSGIARCTRDHSPFFPDGEADSSVGHHVRFYRSNLAYNIPDFSV